MKPARELKKIQKRLVPTARVTRNPMTIKAGVTKKPPPTPVNPLSTPILKPRRSKVITGISNPVIFVSMTINFMEVICRFVPKSESGGHQWLCSPVLTCQTSNLQETTANHVLFLGWKSALFDLRNLFDIVHRTDDTDRHFNITLGK